MRQVFPCGIEEQSRVEGRRLRVGNGDSPRLSTLDFRLSTAREPRFEVLLKTFLRFEVVRDHDEGPFGEKVTQQCGEKRLGRCTDAGVSQCAARLQSPGEGLHGGSLRNSVEQQACRRGVRILRQATGRLQAGPEASSAATLGKALPRARAHRLDVNFANSHMAVLLLAAMLSENNPSTCARDSAPTSRFSVSVLTTGIFCCSLASARCSTSTNR